MLVVAALRAFQEGISDRALAKSGGDADGEGRSRLVGHARLGRRPGWGSIKKRCLDTPFILSVHSNDKSSRSAIRGEAKRAVAI
jgi:hypothetical protein